MYSRQITILKNDNILAPPTQFFLLHQETYWVYGEQDAAGKKKPSRFDILKYGPCITLKLYFERSVSYKVRLYSTWLQISKAALEM